MGYTEDIVSTYAQFRTMNHKNVWSVDQSYTVHTDLNVREMALHHYVENSFTSIPSIGTLEAMHYSLSKIVCQIFSGLFVHQQSKNVLVVGSSSFEKRLLIEALAGKLLHV